MNDPSVTTAPDTTPSHIDEARAKQDYTALGSQWLRRISKARESEKTWRDQAKNAQEAYMGKRLKAFPIVYANVETVVPALISTPPVPDIRPRHYATRPEDPTAMFASQILERGLATLTDDGRLVRELERVAQDAYLAGRATTEIVPSTEGQETLLWRAIPWSHLTIGPCLRWEDAPWIAIEDAVSEDALEDMRDEESRRLLNSRVDRPEAESGDGAPKGTRGLYAVWDKGRKEVITMTTSGEVLRVIPDPMGLPGFFPCPRPVQPIELTTCNEPVCPHSLYLQQAAELDKIQKRIDGLTSALRANGIIVGNSIADAIAALREADDGTLVSVPNIEGFSQTGNLDNAIQWIPIQAIATVLKGLYEAREATKALIYEISGISDVIRGASNPNETATAQGIKNQWGSLRIKRLQAAIEGHARDLFVLAAHFMARAFTPEALARVSATDPNKPEFLKAVDFLSQGLDDTRIDVESGSTARADLGQAKEEMQGFLTAASGYFQTVFPLGQQMPGAAPALIAIFQQFSRYFKLGRQTEDAIDAFAAEVAKGVEQAAQNPPPPNPEEIKAKAQAQKAESDMKLNEQKGQLAQQQAGLDAQKGQQDAALEAEKRDFEREKMAFEREKMQFELQMEALRAQTAREAAMAPKPEPGGEDDGSS